MKQPTPQTQVSASWSATLTIVAVTVLIVADEMSSGVRGWLTSTFSHHWLGKSILAVFLFAVVWTGLRVAFGKREGRSVVRSVQVLIWTAVFATLVLAGLFAYEVWVE